jgi:mannosyltransferase
MKSFFKLYSFIPIGILFLLALLVRLYRLEAQSLWLDEGSTWQFTQMGWAALFADLFKPNAAYPLYHLLLKGWVGLVGDSEFALRLPSAVAGAVSVLLVYWASCASVSRCVGEPVTEPTSGTAVKTDSPPHPFTSSPALLAGLLTALAPFALWYGQEAKVYSLLLCCAAACTWLVLRAVRLNTWRAWLLVATVVLVSVFVHRLALLLVLAAGAAWLGSGGQGDRATRAQGDRGIATVFRLSSFVFLLLASLAVIYAMTRGLGADRAATGAYIPAGPLEALWLTFSRFSLDRWPGDAPWWWLLPWAVLFGWGLIKLIADCRFGAPPTNVRRGEWESERARQARALLCLFVVPLAIFLAQLAFTRVYEARYLIIIFPAWVLVITYPLLGRGPNRRSLLANLYALFSIFCLLTIPASLFQPERGLFSGAPVKEQYREALRELALRVHPDDAVVIHPGYLRPLYAYYMPRLNSDPAPEPLTFADFWQGETSYGQREWDIERRAKLAGYSRSFLLIAPDHARTVDVPKSGDEYGLVGLFWQYSREQNTWPCGIWRYNGAHLLCQEAPERYITGEPLQPQTASGAVFGEQLSLLGYTLKPSDPARPGVYRAGGNLALSLFWDVGQQLSTDYSFFLHLCQNCEIPPAASDDGQPLAGYLPTSSWLPGKPARDDRAIHLPADLPPGRYTLLLGVYRPGDPSPTARLSVRGGEVIGNDRLVIGTVEIVRRPD